jgi:hypothetical protein
MSPPPAPDEEPIRRIVARRAVRWVRREAATPAFGRLLALQACGAAGDALVALALAGSLFFSVPETTARTRVVWYLVATLAPLAVVAPVLWTVLDRHRAGLRATLALSAAGRAVLAWLLAPRLDTLLLFPLAFGILALSRAALVARGAIIPATAPDGRALVAANSSLAKMSALAGIVVIPLGLVLVRTVGVTWDVRLGALAYLAGALPALGLPAGRGPREPGQAMAARRGRRPVGVRQAVVATAGVRALVGFLAFHLAFALRREGLSSIGLGLLIGSAALGTLVGGVLAGRRSMLREEWLIVSSLGLASVAGIGVGVWFSIPLATALVFAFGVGSGASKVAFDSLVQRDTPEAARGWVFARFESALQLAWVAGALVPVALTIPLGPGIVAAGAGAAALAAIYAIGRLRAAAAVRARSGATGVLSPPPPPPEERRWRGPIR